MQHEKIRLTEVDTEIADVAMYQKNYVSYHLILI